MGEEAKVILFFFLFFFNVWISFALFSVVDDVIWAGTSSS